ncbi:TerD family protein [Streptomyces sp. NPDC088358]|uniref:TerD family protein n=1 Tax=Streptomyces sp. NPDC088358 TaxID=3365857 RepID=UPI0037F2521E
MTTTLTKGGNAVLPAAVCRVALSSPTTGIDVSAVLLGQDGKVRSDDDLFFYNHLSQDRVELNGQTIVADLAAIPAAVDRIVVVASIDPELRAAHFDASNTPHAVVECGSARITFEPSPFMHRETVAILIELYRRAGSWKARAVGQGWDTGLAGLASDFGIVVDDPGPAAVQASPVTPTQGQHNATAPRVVPPAPSTTPVRPLVPLGKVALTKAGQATIDMRKDDPNLIVTAALEWNGGSAARRQAGADLDLHALYVPGSADTPPGKRPNKSDHETAELDSGHAVIPGLRLALQQATMPGGAALIAMTDVPILPELTSGVEAAERLRQDPQFGLWHVRGTAVITAKGQFERIKPLNWPLVVCPRQDSNLRHPL